MEYEPIVFGLQSNLIRYKLVQHPSRLLWEPEWFLGMKLVLKGDCVLQAQFSQVNLP